MRNLRYYFGTMSETERMVYKIILRGLANHDQTITVFSAFMPFEQVFAVFSKVMSDTPNLYYVNPYELKSTQTPGTIILYPQYVYSQREIDLLNKDILKTLKKIDDRAQNFVNDPFRLEKFLHDSTAMSVAYDYDALKKKGFSDACTIVGGFLQKRAVCSGISHTFQMLCNIYSIKCLYALGYASENQDYSTDNYHAWNIVKLGDKSYHVDVTWDSGKFRQPRRKVVYDYFNIPTSEIEKDHKLEYSYPPCTSDEMSYFRLTGGCISTYSQLLTFLSGKIGKQFITFKLMKDKGEFLSIDEVMTKLQKAIRESLLSIFNHHNYSFYYNESFSIAYIFEN